MSITNYEILHSEVGGNKLIFVVKYTDHLANEIYHEYRVPQGTDMDAYATAQIPSIEARQAEEEVTNAIGIANEGTSPDIVAEYQAQNDYDRRALGQAMVVEDIYHFNNTRPLYLAMEIRGGANANARAAYLGITRDTYDLISSRYNELAGIQGILNDSKGRIWEDIPEEML
jgi:hypothetical protein